MPSDPWREGILANYGGHVAGISYKKAGVDIDEGDRFVDLVRPLARSTYRKGVLGEIGSFGGLFRLGAGRYRDPVLVSGTDGVGTKLQVAFRARRHDTVGIDLVAMCVNDIVAQGAEPLFFLDYVATGRLRATALAEVVRGIAEGCRQGRCALIGGETAEMPGFYGKGEYELAGFAVGVVERKRIVDGRRVKAGDLVIGLASDGLHSNGFSLVRKLFFDVKGWKLSRRIPGFQGTLGDELLRPTRIYVKKVLPVLGDGSAVGGMAHITGGGITGNLPRAVPKGCSVRVDRGTWPVPPIFPLIMREGGIAEDEMFRTFNMGIGFALIVRRSRAAEVLAGLRRRRQPSWIIGEVIPGGGETIYG